MPDVISVTDLNRKARLAIEQSLPSCWVSGEISNFSKASSGHWYFSLKDAQSSVKCAFFRNRNQFVDWQPGNGKQVEVRAQATLYEPRGDYQLVVDALRPAGQGNLFEQFLLLKAKLEAEGLFNAEFKRGLPSYPQAIGIITSLQAAALQDAIRTLQHRWPLSKAIIYPCAVQGATAAGTIIEAMETAQDRGECDVLLLIRGGGSLEDLYAFNDENLARAIHRSTIPVVTGIGHETDFTIADFISDKRSPTPTAAAQSAVPDRVEVMARIQLLGRSIESRFRSMLNQHMQSLDNLGKRLLHPGKRLQRDADYICMVSSRMALLIHNRLRNHKDRLALDQSRLKALRPETHQIRLTLDGISLALQRTLLTRISEARHRVLLAKAALQQLGPENVLARGFAIVRDDQGSIIRHSGQVMPGCAIKVTLQTGQLLATVNGVK